VAYSESRLKITRVKVYPLGYIEKEPWERVRNFALIEVETDEGVSGFGEASDCYGHSFPHVVERMVEDAMQRHLIGEDPHDQARILRKLSTVYQHFGPYGAPVQTISGIEIALWDIIGKVSHLPITRLLGGAKDRVPVYAGGPLDFTKTPAECADFYRGLVERGMKAVKIRIGYNWEWDEEFVRLTRDAIGDKTKLMVDGFMNYTPASAIRASKMLARYDAFYFEEPLSIWDLGTMSEVRKKAETPIALGEHVYLHGGFKAVVDAKAADYLTPDVTVCGGITECKKIFELAESSGIPIVQHCGGLTAVGISANLQALCSYRRETYIEYDSKPVQPMRDEIVKERLFGLDKLVSGKLVAPMTPGLGISVRKDVLSKYPTVKLPPQITMPTYGMGMIE